MKGNWTTWPLYLHAFHSASTTCLGSPEEGSVEVCKKSGGSIKEVGASDKWLSF